MSQIDVFEALAASYGALCSAVMSTEAVIGQVPGLRYGALGGGMPDINRLMPTRMRPDTFEADLASTMERLDAVPLLSAWIPPEPEPADIADRLIAYGFREDPGEESIPAMVADLASLPDLEVQPAIEFVRACSRQQLDTANGVLAEGFGAPPEVGELLADLTADGVLAPDSPIRVFYALLDGRPVATALGIVHADMLGIYSVATLPDVRGRGLGRGITLTVMLDAASRGARVAVLESSKLGQPVYERLGFNEAGRYRILTRSVADDSA